MPVGQSQEEPSRCQLTMLGSHSVEIGDQARSTCSTLPQLGHGGVGLSEVDRYSSNLASHAVQRYS